MDPFSASEIAAVILAALVGLGTGVLLGRNGRAPLQEEINRLLAEVARSESQAREHSRQIARLRAEQETLARLSRSLPGLVQELNRSDLHDRDIPRLLFSLSQDIFQAEWAALFLVRSPGEDTDKAQELLLVDRCGFAEPSGNQKRLRLGQGKVGWVAENRVEMQAEDWLNLSRTEGHTIEDNPGYPRFELIGPLVHQADFNHQLLGVFCLGNCSARSRDDKLMLQMITNLGSIAIINSRNSKLLRQQANEDGLTRLLNKRHFLSQELGLMIHRAEREGQPIAVFIFDIDHFKAYNDSNGHLAGDEILRGVARVLRENLRPGDLACRYGGEEFIVAMPNVAGEHALQAAERIREAMASHPFARAESQPEGRLTISGGVAVFPVDGTNSTDLIGHADQALYQAKAAGRNRVILFKGIHFGASEEDDDIHPAWQGTLDSAGGG